jgi:hypothetical protein
MDRQDGSPDSPDVSIHSNGSSNSASNNTSAYQQWASSSSFYASSSVSRRQVGSRAIVPLGMSPERPALQSDIDRLETSWERSRLEQDAAYLELRRLLQEKQSTNEEVS